MDEQIEVRLDKLINKFIHESKKFVDYACFPYGLMDLMRANIKSQKLVYDYEYFTFTKSTKSLISIRRLLKLGHNEDIFIIVRSIFENYLSCRYLQEHPTKIDNFVKNPLELTLAHYKINTDTGEILTRNDEIVGKREDPKAFKIGKDKKYYYSFYDFLCIFAHCNFGVIDCYTRDNALFTIDKVNYSVLSRVFTIFVFTKIFETVVTVEGEDFLDKQTEKNCYQLVKNSIQIQEEVFDLLISEYKGNEVEFYKFRNKRVREMLKNMKKSLSEEIGSIDKSNN